MDTRAFKRSLHHSDRYNRRGFGLGEEWPRGQMNAWVMPALLVQHPGHWRGIFQQPNRAKFHEPTVEGIDFPMVRVRTARYEAATRTLSVGLTTMDPESRGRPTRFRVTRLPRGSRAVVVTNGEAGVEHRAPNGQITIETTVNDQAFDIHVG